jgi:recombination protein RecA
MIDRVQLQRKGAGYFAGPQPGVTFVSSGCTPFDCALGGGWATDRIINIIGDESTGKTLLCIEMCANFARQFPKGKIFYRELESAFDEQYAGALGMPLERIDFGSNDIETVEDMFADMLAVLKKLKGPGLYICDSLDSLSDEAELKRAINKGSFGAAKAKKMSELFRQLVREMQRKHLTVVIVSQTRDKIGVMFGEKKTTSGGNALKFYSSQRVMLSQVSKIVKPVKKIKYVTGILIRARVIKNKVGVPYKQVQFPIKFGYGIDDKRACTDWLELTGQKVTEGNLPALVKKRWYEIDAKMLPTERKYG